MTGRTIILAALMLSVLNAGAQTLRPDSTATGPLRVGYSTAGENTLAGAVDKVTEDRMNKGLKMSSLDALSSQAAGVQVTSGGHTTLYPIPADVMALNLNLVQNPGY